MKNKESRAGSPAIRGLPWIYGAVAMATLTSISMYEAGRHLVFSLCADGLLLIAFVALATRLGLGAHRTSGDSQLSEDRVVSGSPCRQSSGA